MRQNKPVLRFFLALLFSAAAITSVLAAESANVKAKAAQCFACHGADGLSKTPDAPNLAGQNESYLISALTAYRSGARVHEVMSLMAKNLSDDDIQQLASYFNGLPAAGKAP